ncbi:unnamed protein product [Ranitomeya imitator]|uniref:Uncharacterized protein n=1 Tax=Ranitomeya imitator TaxID=111125 RepID=A0ABN9KZT2_9NEOB|nr:unnamed protein product [Ranitomeya imitator]
MMEESGIETTPPSTPPPSTAGTSHTAATAIATSVPPGPVLDIPEMSRNACPVDQWRHLSPASANEWLYNISGHFLYVKNGTWKYRLAGSHFIESTGYSDDPICTVFFTP